jgi:dienelactone hydrolase
MMLAMEQRFAQFPAALERQSSRARLGPTEAPALLVHPDWKSPRPTVLWMHGRTVFKELDPGRYLRWMRAGIATCAIDLYGHGERYEAAYHEPERTLEVVEHTINEIDGIVDALTDLESGIFDYDHLAIGGMSAGGMVTLARCCSPHPFKAITVEATAGDWQFQRRRAMFVEEVVERLNPIDRLDGWTETPFQAFHSEGDQWVPEAAMAVFVEALRQTYRDPALVEYITYDETGAPYEHAGFGRKARDAKDRQLAFLSRHFGLGADASA